MIITMINKDDNDNDDNYDDKYRYDYDDKYSYDYDDKNRWLPLLSVLCLGCLLLVWIKVKAFDLWSILLLNLLFNDASSNPSKVFIIIISWLLVDDDDDDDDDDCIDLSVLLIVVLFSLLSFSVGLLIATDSGVAVEVVIVVPAAAVVASAV